LAELLSTDSTRVAGDLEEACARARADLLVSRKLPASFELVSSAVPIDFKPAGVKAVVAAVAGGPHSELNVLLATTVGKALGVETLIATAYFTEESKAEAEAKVERVLGVEPRMPRFSFLAEDPAGFISQLPEKSLLVLGEPGGSFLSRSFFGPGARLRSRAPSGAVIVRHAPQRVFHVMGEPVFVGPLHLAGDSLRLHPHSMMAVVENGRLVGVVRRRKLQTANPGAAVGDLMDEPLAVRWDQSLEEAGDTVGAVDESPLPVTDGDGRLVGALGR
jgi:CBS domain-containing protein